MPVILIHGRSCLLEPSVLNVSPSEISYRDFRRPLLGTAIIYFLSHEYLSFLQGTGYKFICTRHDTRYIYVLH